MSSETTPTHSYNLRQRSAIQKCAVPAKAKAKPIKLQRVKFHMVIWGPDRYKVQDELCGSGRSWFTVPCFGENRMFLLIMDKNELGFFTGAAKVPSKYRLEPLEKMTAACQAKLSPVFKKYPNCHWQLYYN
jgi:hypothetical protein